MERVATVSRAEIVHTYPLPGRDQTLSAGTQPAHWVTEKTLWCNAGETCQKRALWGAKESCSQGGVSVEAFYYKTFRGVVTGEAAGHGDTECDTGAGAGERHTHFSRTRKQSLFLLCPLLAKLNVVPAGKGKIIKGPTFTSQSRLWVNLELSGYQWLTGTWGNHPRLLPLLIFLVQLVPRPTELAPKTSGLLHSCIIIFWSASR